MDSAWWINAACQATIVNNSRSGAQGISTNVALPKGGLLGYNDYYDGEVEGKGDDDYDADDKDNDDDDGDDNDDDAQSKY